MTVLFAAVPAPELWWIDAAVAGLLALSAVFGAFNGLSGESARLVAFAVALVVASLVFTAIRTGFFPDGGTAARVLSLAAAGLRGAPAPETEAENDPPPQEESVP